MLATVYVKLFLSIGESWFFGGSLTFLFALFSLSSSPCRLRGSEGPPDIILSVSSGLGGGWFVFGISRSGIEGRLHSVCPFRYGDVIIFHNRVDEGSGVCMELKGVEHLGVLLCSIVFSQLFLL